MKNYLAGFATGAAVVVCVYGEHHAAIRHDLDFAAVLLAAEADVVFERDSLLEVADSLVNELERAEEERRHRRLALIKCRLELGPPVKEDRGSDKTGSVADAPVA